MGNYCGIKESKTMKDQGYDMESPSGRSKHTVTIPSDTLKSPISNHDTLKSINSNSNSNPSSYNHNQDQFKFVLDDDDLLISNPTTTKSPDSNHMIKSENNDHESSKMHITHANPGTRVINNSYTFTETLENPLDQWVKQLTAASEDDEQDIIFTFTESETEFGSDSESELVLTLQIEGEHISASIPSLSSPRSKTRKDTIFELSDINGNHTSTDHESGTEQEHGHNDSKFSIAVPNIAILSPQSSNRPNLYRPKTIDEQQSYTWDSSDMEDLEDEMKFELHRIHSLDSPMPQNHPRFLPKRSSNLVQSLACDWDMEALQIEEDQMRRYLSHLRDNGHVVSKL